MWRSGRFAILAAALVLAGAGARAQDPVSQQTARPPAGAAYVRVVDLSRSGALIGVDVGSGVAAAKGEAATIYRIVRGGAPLTLTRAGKPLKGSVTPPTDGFATIVIDADGNTLLIRDTAEEQGGETGPVNFYNLVPGCTASVGGADGALLFDAVAPNETRRGLIMPGETALVGRCGETLTEPLRLPSFKAGDRLSLFMVPGPEGAGAPMLAIQRDEIEPYGNAN